ncbi:MAG: hypothetical protein PVS2B2_17260 [Candidatus Acidiferrum sp.]
MIVRLNESMDVLGGGAKGMAVMVKLSVALPLPPQLVTQVGAWLQEFRYSTPNMVTRSKD